MFVLGRFLLSIISKLFFIIQNILYKLKLKKKKNRNDSFLCVFFSVF